MTISLRVVWRVAAGPLVGFGHLVRCRSLARAMSVDPTVSVRGTPSTFRAAAALGCLPVHVRSTRALRDLQPSLLVVDDPCVSHAQTWIRHARRSRVPVASIHDMGLAHVDSDLRIDGSVAPGGCDLEGPAYAVLDPSVLDARDRGRRPEGGAVLIALGGGTHGRILAARLARAIAQLAPIARIRITRGFSSSEDIQLASGEWVSAPDGLADELSRTSIAVVAGGMTLYEACAIGVPVVAVAVTPAQHETVRAAARLGAAIDGGLAADDCVVARVAGDVSRLLTSPSTCDALSATASALVDGRGALRVADRLRQLASGVGANAARDREGEGGRDRDREGAGADAA